MSTPLDRLAALERQSRDRKARRPVGCQAGDTGYCPNLDHEVCAQCVEIKAHRDRKDREKRQAYEDFQKTLKNPNVVHTAHHTMGNCKGCPAKINFGDQFVWRPSGLYHIEHDPKPELQEKYWERWKKGRDEYQAVKGVTEGMARIFSDPKIPRGFR